MDCEVPRSAKKCQEVVQSESDSMPDCALPSGFAVPYQFSISITRFQTCLHVVHIQHVALKGLRKFIRRRAEPVENNIWRGQKLTQIPHWGE